MANKVNDLRSALELLKGIDGQLIETDVEVDPMAELSGVYRHIGAGGTVSRPTKEGPAMVFNNVKGHPGARVAIGLLASRRRVGYLLDCDPKRLGFMLNDSVANPIAPQVIAEGEVTACQEVVYMADDPGFDVRKLVPAPTNTEEDAGPYITMGMCYAHDVETGEHDVTIHRLCLQGPDTISMFFTPGARHLGAFRRRPGAGQAAPISISIGVDPAIEIGACFEPPTTPVATMSSPLRAQSVRSRSSWPDARQSTSIASPTPSTLSRASCCPTPMLRRIKTPVPARQCPSSLAIPALRPSRFRS